MFDNANAFAPAEKLPKKHSVSITPIVSVSMCQIGTFEDHSYVSDILTQFLEEPINLPQKIGFVSATDGTKVVRINIQKYMVISGEGSLEPLFSKSFDYSKGTITDLSQSRSGVKIEGPDAEWRLQQELGFDLDIQNSPIGTAFQSQMFHIPVLGLRTGVNSFELYVFRSFFKAFIECLENT